MGILRAGLCFVGVLLIVSACVVAQDAKISGAGQGSIGGTVSDQTGAVLPGATATVTNQAGLSQTANTNERGEYSFTALPVGTYTITVSAPAFKDFHAEGIMGAAKLVPPYSLAVQVVWSAHT